MADSNFIDYVKIYFASGNGGAGSAHLARSRENSKGGPDGGDGGRGGHIILRGNDQMWTLLPLKYQKHIKAGHGEIGLHQQMTGATGEDIFVDVPLGTIAKDAETGEVICEILDHDQEVILIPGGMGGRGNTHFKSPTNQTPRYAQPGIPGTDQWVVLELKVLADVGLVGFPNAGKSTLLSVISAAKPKVADYAFTTLVPNLGVVEYRDHKSFVMADIPGIIEGAAEGKGLGHRFLRHIERNAVLLFLIPADADDIAKTYNILLNELTKYNPQLLHKDRILAITKSDVLDDELKNLLIQEIKDLNPLFISSVAQQGLQELKDVLWDKINS